jgi:cellobiose-specific phosphotransferase system component IIB
MQNMNEILDISPDEPDVILPPIERVDEDEILFAKDLTYREEVRARARTVLTLMEHGMQVEETDHTTRDATAVFNEKEDLENHADKPDVILRLEAMLTEYDHEVVDDAVRMRRFIMNRLMEESQIGTKSSERLKALELLGKVTEVGMFTERQQITVHTQSTQEIEEELERTLTLLLNPTTKMYEPQEKEVSPIKDIKIRV